MKDAETATGLTDVSAALGKGAKDTTTYGITVIVSDDKDLVGRQVGIGAGLVLGRSEESDVFPQLAISDSRVSRKHATIRRISGQAAFEIVDNRSRNGTFVDGVRSFTRPLRAGALVRVGNTMLEFGPVAAAPSLASGGDEHLFGRSAAFRAVLANAFRVAPSSMTVTLVGETGTGKDVLARRIHERSGRSGPFIAVNCAAIPAELSESTLFGHRKGAFTGADKDSLGFFGEAEGGTLFLDEVGELPLAQQAKLLRVLENHEYTPVGSTKVRMTDARVIAATNADLVAAVRDGRFRADLFARLAGTLIELPPLRERRLDIPLLARMFLRELAPRRELSLDVGAVERLLLHPWPLNIRELRTLVQRLVQLKEGDGVVSATDVEAVMGKVVPTAPLAAETGDASVDRSGERPGSEELAGLLQQFHGNVARVAAHYGKDTKQIYRWLKRYHLEPDEYR
jgi:sigma-54 dependent transcriptional regulator, acetoin dehydrogenase operon transcriptional activator AcoR